VFSPRQNRDAAPTPSGVGQPIDPSSESLSREQEIDEATRSRASAIQQSASVLAAATLDQSAVIDRLKRDLEIYKAATARAEAAFLPGAAGMGFLNAIVRRIGDAASAVATAARVRRHAAVIESSGLFDRDWYLAKYPDVRAMGVDPVLHYVKFGSRRGLYPNPMFDSDWYLAGNQALRDKGGNPLVHFIRHGWRLGKDPSPRFDTNWYVGQNADVRASGVNPLAHYLAYGRAEGRLSRPQSGVAMRRNAPTRYDPGRYDVIVLANIDWSARFQRPQQLALQFAGNGHRVFYIAAAGHDAGSGRFFDKTLVAENVFQVRFAPELSFDHYSGVLGGQRLAAFITAFDALAREERIADAVLHVHLPSWTDLALALRQRHLWRVIYDCMDDWDGFPLIASEVHTAESTLIAEADCVVATGSVIYDKRRGDARRCEIVRNGVDAALFFERCRPNPRFSFDHPVIGYYGAIAEWIDLDLIAELADRHPEWNFVLAGDVFVRTLSGLNRKPNVTFLGLRPFEEMPELLWHFDVCLIPFRLNAITDAVDPVKLYEYLAGGKPVVASPIREIEPYRDVVDLVQGADEYEKAIERALADSDPHRAAERRAVASRNTWFQRYQDYHALSSLYPRVSVVIVAFNNLDLTRACIDSVLANSTLPDLEVVVVDNGSTDGTREFLAATERRARNVRVIANRENRGFPAANNQALANVTGEVIVLLNNDVIVPRGWLTGMLRCLADGSVGLAGPVTNSIGNEARIAVTYDLSSLDEMEDFAAQWMDEHRGVTFDIPMLAMYCLAMRRDVLAKVGLLDEEYGIGMFEDDDYSNRARAAGFRLVCTEESFVQHFGQASFKELHSKGTYQALWDRNLARYESRWGPWKPHKPRGRAVMANARRSPARASE
jgi:GT2 family glycosyltransferase/glycosyltransferase involved in cell wall biosynthesis